MIRSGIVFILMAAATVGALALAGEPGRASVVWLGWRADTSAAVAILLAMVFGLLSAVVWRTILWILDAPRRAEQRRTEARRRQANDVLARGFLAVAAGDGPEARRHAKKAAELAADAPGLVRVLAAQSAEAAGDTEQAHAAYTAMLGFPEMRLAGHKGLMQLALARGARDTALRHAQDAYAETRTARWAWRAVLEARLEAADWDAARELVKGAPGPQGGAADPGRTGARRPACRLGRTVGAFARRQGTRPGSGLRRGGGQATTRLRAGCCDGCAAVG